MSPLIVSAFTHTASTGEASTSPPAHQHTPGMMTTDATGATPTAATVTAALQCALAPAGLDIVHAFPVQLLNAGCPQEHQLPTYGRAGSTLGVIVGNSAGLWAPFIAHLAGLQQQQQPGRRQQQHEQPPSSISIPDNPLEAYVEQHVSAALARVCQPGVACTLRFSHQTEPARFVNMMRAAQVSGLAYYSTTTHLCVHPVFGPWFALRAVAVLDLEGPEPAAFAPLPCPHPDLEQQAAVEMQRLEQLGGLQAWQQHWREWAALRALGGKHTDPRYAYSAEQLQFHYTKDAAVLQRAVATAIAQQQPEHQPEHQPEQHQPGAV